MRERARGSHVRLERRARRRHQRPRPHARRRQVRRRRARVPRAPAVLVEVLRAAHRVPPLDAALRHAVLALQLRRAPRARRRALAPPHAGRPVGVGAAAVEALGAQHARRVARRRAAQRLGALRRGALVVGVAGVGLVGVAALVVVVGQRLVAGAGPRAARAGAVLLLGVVGVGAGAAARPALGLVAAGGGVARVAREPGGLELVRARGGRGARAAGGGRAAARLGLLVVLLALVRVRDAAVVERRRVVQRPQFLVERAGQRRHEVAGPCG